MNSSTPVIVTTIKTLPLVPVMNNQSCIHHAVPSSPGASTLRSIFALISLAGLQQRAVRTLESEKQREANRWQPGE